MDAYSCCGRPTRCLPAPRVCSGHAPSTSSSAVEGKLRPYHPSYPPPPASAEAQRRTAEPVTQATDLRATPRWGWMLQLKITWCRPFSACACDVGAETEAVDKQQEAPRPETPPDGESEQVLPPQLPAGAHGSISRRWPVSHLPPAPRPTLPRPARGHRVSISDETGKGAMIPSRWYSY